jgi:hypothetical protein
MYYRVTVRKHDQMGSHCVVWAKNIPASSEISYPVWLHAEYPAVNLSAQTSPGVRRIHPLLFHAMEAVNLASITLYIVYEATSSCQRGMNSYFEFFCVILDTHSLSDISCMALVRRLWCSRAIITLQLRYNDISIRYNVILSAKSILKTVSSYLLFVMSILNTLCYNSAQFCFTVMSILISLCHNSEPLCHNSERCFIIRNAMSILWRSKAIIIN